MPQSSSGKLKQASRKATLAASSSSKAKKAKKKKAARSSAAKEHPPSTQEIEQAIGHHFSDAGLLLQAVTHRSYAQESSPPEADNERLEFLGDAVLQLIVTKRLWSDLSEEDEGVLTRRRSEKVSGRALAKVARQMGFSEFLRLGRGELKTGGRQKPSILAAALEALVGAIYLDAGHVKCAKLVESWLWGEENAGTDGDDADYKSMLQEQMQRKDQRLPVYCVISETGPEHQKEFEIEVRHGKNVLGRGTGKNKKEAEQAAARKSLIALKAKKPAGLASGRGREKP